MALSIFFPFLLESVSKFFQPTALDDWTDKLNHYWVPFIHLWMVVFVGAQSQFLGWFRCYQPDDLGNKWDDWLRNYCFIEELHYKPFPKTIAIDEMNVIFHTQSTIAYYWSAPLFILALTAAFARLISKQELLIFLQLFENGILQTRRSWIGTSYEFNGIISHNNIAHNAYYLDKCFMKKFSLYYGKLVYFISFFTTLHSLVKTTYRIFVPSAGKRYIKEFLSEYALFYSGIDIWTEATSIEVSDQKLTGFLEFLGKELPIEDNNSVVRQRLKAAIAQYDEILGA
ncbi:unnamed protein product, partial [Mesorhabditis spiculigera]